jgi:Reverse transcriptase (RNA-dependent DNA polymerase)
MTEMANVRVAFQVFDGERKQLSPGYQEIKCHMIFDVKLGKNFRRKARYVAEGHATDPPSSITYSSVISRESVRVTLLIAALNDLEVLSADIQNAYLHAKCQEKIWTKAGPDFGSDEGSVMIIVCALYGLKSSHAAFWSLLANQLYDIGFGYVQL